MIDLEIKSFIKDILKKTAIELIVTLLVMVVTTIGGGIWALVDFQGFTEFFNLAIPLWGVLTIIILLMLVYSICVLRLKNSWKSYKSDTYLGITFSWEYDKNYNIDSLNVYCPQCGIKMNGVTDIDAPIVVFGHANYYRCPVCKVECNYSEDIFINRIKTNIEKKKKKI
ncbi:hypothetical protein [Phocaeicola plebeius]|uniref:hypothetical protein n=1 Tax=Phocaeicola plebeius TaxID=310297 RepID=UPI00195C2778|nr:hypothetical protein [Phocaeicola plebeius]